MNKQELRKIAKNGESSKVEFKTADAHVFERIRDVLNNFPEIHVAILFGSAVKNRLTPDSDIDIAVSGEHPLEYSQKSDLHYALSTVLSHEVDLIDLHEVSGLILRQVLGTGVIVKKDSTTLFAALLKKMWYNQADMMPHTLMILKKHCRRFAYG